MRDVLHLFYLFNRIRPHSQFFLTWDSSQHLLQREAAADWAPSVPLRSGGEQLLQEGFLQLSETLRPFAFVLHFKNTWHLFPFGKPITQTDRLFLCHERYLCGSLYFGPIWSTLSPQQCYCRSIQFFLWPRNPWNKGRGTCGPSENYHFRGGLSGSVSLENVNHTTKWKFWA